MKLLLVAQLLLMAVGVLLFVMARNRRVVDFPIVSSANPINPMKYKDKYGPVGFRYYLSGLVTFELGLICGVIYWFAK